LLQEFDGKGRNQYSEDSGGTPTTQREAADVARKIQLRAIVRGDELLEQVKSAQGGDRRSQEYQRDGGDRLISRQTAAERAQLSERQAKTMIRAARVPEPY
jgi:hypothetical protein